MLNIRDFLGGQWYRSVFMSVATLENRKSFAEMEHAEVKPAGIHTLMQIPDSDSSNVFCNGHDTLIAAGETDRDQRAPLGRSESQAISNIRESSEEGDADRGGYFLC